MPTAITKEKRKIAKLILHDLEIRLEAKVGSMEHDIELQDCVVENIQEPENTCNCNCRICKLGDHD